MEQRDRALDIRIVIFLEGKHIHIISLTENVSYDNILSVRGRGVAANMRPCQGRDRGFETRRSRLNTTDSI